VKNDRPIVAAYGVNAEGSGDMYYKGGNLLHTIRHVIGNYSTWRAILRGLNQGFGHRVVTGREVQDYISQRSGIDLGPVFAQYLTTTRIPIFEYRTDGATLAYRWSDVVPGFAMPVRVIAESGDTLSLVPTAGWQTVTLPPGPPGGVSVDEDFYVITRRLE
jgi:aminopeptidase N